MADEQDETSPNEVTLFRPGFAKLMFLQKAEEAGFFSAMEPEKWSKLFSLMQERGIGFYHAEPDAKKIIDSAHARNKDMMLRMRGEGNGTTA
jgi:uncharacterized protein YjcR